jgi:hypothetical protein
MDKDGGNEERGLAREGTQGMVPKREKHSVRKKGERQGGRWKGGGEGK